MGQRWGGAPGYPAPRCLEAKGPCVCTCASGAACARRYLVGVGAVLVLGTVGGVGEGLVAALMLTHVWLLPSVGPQVRLQVLQAGVGLRTALELEEAGWSAPMPRPNMPQTHRGSLTLGRTQPLPSPCLLQPGARAPRKVTHGISGKPGKTEKQRE